MNTSWHSRYLVAVPLLAGFAVVVASLAFARAASLGLTSTGVVVNNRTYGSPLTCTLTASSDTYVRRDQATSSFGSQTTLDVSNSASNTRRALVLFDLSACSPAIASDAIVRSATVRLTTASGIGLAGRDYELHEVTTSWNETTTWNSQPSVVATTSSTVTIPALTGSGTTFQWPVARDVQAFIAGDESNLGWRLKDTVENGGVILPATVSITFGSSEAASNRPQLVITYAP